MSAWILLGVAIAMEVAATSLLKASNGFTKPLYGMVSIALYSVCFWVLAFAFQKIPMAVAYAIWSGIGIAAITAIGVFVFRQSLSPLQALCIAMIALGAVGLNLTTPHDADAPDQRVGTGSAPE